MKRFYLVLSTALLATASTAQAHLTIESHAARENMNNQKTGPCGKANSKRGTKIHTFAPGETIELVVDEYIPHPGWFRISFDQDGEDDFRAPKTLEPPSLMDNPTVLMDGLDMHKDRGAGGTHSWKVKLPDVECTNCTLQVIQVMLDKPPYDPQDNGALSNDLYYACLDVVLKRDGTTPASPTDASVSSRDAGVSAPEMSDSGAPIEPGASEPPSKNTTARDAAAAVLDAGARGRDSEGSRDAARAKDSGARTAEHDEHEDDVEDQDVDGDGDDVGENDQQVSAEENGCSLRPGGTDRLAGLGLLATIFSIVAARRRRLSLHNRHARDPADA